MTSSDRIFLSAPDVGEEEEAAVVRALRSGWVAPGGPEVEAFEAELCSFIGGDHAVALNSGTAALHLGAKAVGVGLGDSVITSTMTFVATANAMAYLGASPVFVDSLDDGSPDPSLVEQAIEAEHRFGRRVGAILPVDIYGRAANYSELLPIAQSYGIPLLVDAAEALGSAHAGKMAGVWGDVSALSFNGNKIMTTSGGGMVTTPDAEKADYVRHLATQAKEPAGHYEHLEVGYNYRMSNICAALGRAQLAKLPQMIARRRALRAEYEAFFLPVSGVTMLTGSNSEDNCWLSAITIDSEIAGFSPRDLQMHLEHHNIETRLLWKPMHLQPLFAGSRHFGGSVSERLFKTGLALPSGSGIGHDDKSRILSAISGFIESR